MAQLRKAYRRASNDPDAVVAEARAAHGGLLGLALHLQSTAGNRATTAALQRRAEPARPTTPPVVAAPREELPAFADVHLKGEPQVLNPSVRRGEAVLTRFSVVNNGTGKTTKADSVSVVPTYGGTSWSKYSQEHDFGASPIAPNGGTKTLVARFTNLRIQGNWEMVFAIFQSPKWIEQKAVPFHIGPPA